MESYISLSEIYPCDLSFTDEVEIKVAKEELLETIKAVQNSFLYFNMHINRKVLHNALYGTTNNRRRLHGGCVIRQRAYVKNVKNRQATRRRLGAK